MRLLLQILIVIFMLSCSEAVDNRYYSKMKTTFTEEDILEQLDFAFHGTPTRDYPIARPVDVKYNFFLDLEHGYCETAGSRIHLYADKTNWAIVFEKSGYKNREKSADIELNYVGNCINYSIEKYPERNYITNTSNIILIEPTEFDRIENKEGKGLEVFELIGQGIKEIKVRDKVISFDNNYMNYEKFGIQLRDYDNPNKLIGFGDLIRYLHETNPSLISATENDIRKHIPEDLPKLITIDEFHFVSIYEEATSPRQQETYKLIAKVLVSRDTCNWRPTEKPNNRWVNWKSGNL